MKGIHIVADCKQQPMVVGATLSIELSPYDDGSTYEGGGGGRGRLIERGR